MLRADWCGRHAMLLRDQQVPRDKDPIDNLAAEMNSEMIDYHINNTPMKTKLISLLCLSHEVNIQSNLYISSEYVCL